MRSRQAVTSALVVAFLLICGAAYAHHGTANYLTTKSVTVKGTVTDFEFVNPHVLVYMDVKDDSGKVTKWQGELTSPNRLARVGWHKDSIKVGDTVTMSGFPAKSGAPEIWIQKVELPSGETLPTGIGN